ncbi:trypsin-like peptidase domain-containing protein [Rhizorhabdus dicambivorans]|uniref:trypsin-like peptidase domain-containing protein n=1 Tax=Rhizorhabdus dicambivorans TaxID=1850238 RepID=UPI00083093C2|nr:trypsin-like peptidase domain-containing protein [Rhizorhabdus dicambivorans]
MTGSTPTGGARRILARLSLLALLAGTTLAATAHAAVLGPDDRDEADAFLSTTQETQFEGLGRIECLQAGSKGVSFNATGWVVGAADTVITAAHTFFRRDRRGQTADVRDPDHCIFVLYNADQSIREIANIRYAVSPWADRSVRGDGSFDFAVLKLARPLHISRIPAVGTGGSIRPRVELLAFQSGVRQDQRARVTRGHTQAFPYSLVAPSEGSRVTDGSRLFASSANSSAGSSGGLYYDSRANVAFGVHIGTLCDTDAAAPAYDPMHCFNYGLRFDRRILATIDMVVRDNPAAEQVVRSDIPYPTAAATLLALAEDQSIS